MLLGRVAKSTGLLSNRMIRTYRFLPSNVCSKEMIIEVDGDVIKKITTVRGCPGNTQGVNRLCEGRRLEEVASLLKGIRCPGSKNGITSCPNELASALKAIRDGKLEPIDNG